MKRKINLGVIIGLVLSVFVLMGASKTANAAEVEVGNISEAYTQINNTAIGGEITLKLTGDFSLGQFSFSDKNITIDLNGHTLSADHIYMNNGGSLHIINTAYALSGGELDINGYLYVSKAGIVDTAQDGIINVNGYVSVSDTGTRVTVNNVTCNSDAYPVTAGEGSTIVINGDISSSTSYSGGYGVYVSGSNSSVTVNGDISVNGNSCAGVYIYYSVSNAHITINGSITATGSNSSGILINGSSSAVTVAGDVTAESMGANTGSKSSNQIVVYGSLTVNADNAYGVNMGFGSLNVVDVRGDIVTNGTSARGVYVSNSYGDSANPNTVHVGESVIAKGDSSYSVIASSGGIITVGGNINTALKSDGSYTTGSYPVQVSGSSRVSIDGSVNSSESGVQVTYGGTAVIAGNIEVYVPGGSYSYSAASISDNDGTITVDGDITISGNSTSTLYGIFGGYFSTGGAVRVYGNISVTNNSGSADGINCQSSRNVTVDGDVTVTGTNYVYGINAYNAEVYVKGKISATGGSNNAGIYASGSSIIKADKDIDATDFIKSYVNSSVITISKGSGTFNTATNYYDYSLGSTTVSIKGWQLTVEAQTGGVAGIGGTEVTSGCYEAGTQVNILASDTVMGYDFNSWSSVSASFLDSSSASTSFAMPAEDTTVTASFSEVAVYNIDFAADITGGNLIAEYDYAEAGAEVELTITPDSGKTYVANSLYYSYNGHDYPLTVSESTGLITASFIMPEYTVTVTADFINITEPTITTTTLPNGKVQQAYSQTLTHSSNVLAVWSIDSGTLPNGLSLSEDGVISGIPDQEGDYTFTVKTTNGGGSDTQELSITIKTSNPEFTTEELPDGTEDEEYEVQINANYLGTANWSAEGLPSGLEFDNGRISGTISEEIAAETSYTIHVTIYSYYFNYNPYEYIDYGSTSVELTLKVEPAPTHELSFEAGSNGSIISGTAGSYDKNQMVQIEAEPEEGYMFNGWISSDGGSFDDASSSATTFYMPDNATTVTASFVINPITVKQDITQYVIINNSIHFVASDIAADANSEELTITAIKSASDEYSGYLGAELYDGTLYISGNQFGSTSIVVTVSNGVVSLDITVPITVQGNKLDTPDNLGWSIYDGIYAYWDDVSADSYTLQFFKDGIPLGGEITGIYDTYLEFSFTMFMNGTGTYTFTVTAIGDGEEYIDSDTSELSEEYYFSLDEPEEPVNVIGISIDQPLINLTVGSGEILTITINPSNATNQSVTWLSSDTAIAAVDDSGCVTGVAEGEATITVTTVDGGYQAAITAYVTAQSGGGGGPETIAVTGISLSQATLSLIAGETGNLTANVLPATATNQSVTWLSSNTAIAAVDDSGCVTGVAEGEATITATTVDGGYQASITVYVTAQSGGGGGPETIAVTGISLSQATLSLIAGETGNLTVNVLPATATNQSVTWSSNDTGVATVDDSGCVTGVSEGEATITVTTVDGGYQTSITVYVEEGGNEPETIAVTGISLSQSTLSLIVGEAGNLTANISPATATNKSVTWSSSNTGVARVNGNGTVTAVTAGTAIITVTSVDGGYTANCTVYVNFISNPGSDNGNTGTGNNGTGSEDNNTETDTSQESEDSVNLQLGGDNSEEWKDIEKIISGSNTANYTIDMDGSTVIPKDLLDTIQGRDVTVTLVLDDGIEWIINGNDIPEPGNSTDNTQPSSIDLNVTMNANNIPENLLLTVPGNIASIVQVALSHEGSFGFHATLRIKLEASGTGNFASLYYYNTVSNELELQSISPIGTDGFAQFDFAHASDYVILVDDGSAIDFLAQQITVTPANKTLYVGGTKEKSVQLKVTVPDQLQQLISAGSCPYTVSYASSKPSIATVSNGKITAHNIGKVVITVSVTVKGITRDYQLAITVKNAYIKLTKSVKTLKSGQSFTFEAVGYGVDSDAIVWTTTEKSIVIINKVSGKATAKSTGIDYVVARVGNVTYKIKVVVK